MQETTKSVIYKARQKVRENQSEFACTIGKSQSLVSKYERGEVTPPGDVISHCMNILYEQDDEVSMEKLTLAINQLSGDKFSATRKSIHSLVMQLTLSNNPQNA
jgi:predicted transcriptional regulator